MWMMIRRRMLVMILTIMSRMLRVLVGKMTKRVVILVLMGIMLRLMAIMFY